MNEKTYFCNKCQQHLPASAFYYRKNGKRISACKSCLIITSQVWRDENPDKVVEQNRVRSPIKKQWYQDNLGRAAAQMHERYLRNREETIARAAKWKRENRAAYRVWQKSWRDVPAHKIEMAFRIRLWHALKGKVKSVKTATLLGCGISEWKATLEKQFKPGMTWENYGTYWEIDHKKPCAEFDLNDPAQQLACCHFSNLQPLTANENRRKGAKWNG